MKRLLGLAMATMVAACNGLGSDQGGAEEGGANANDRSSGDGDSERLLTGAMAVSPTGDYIVARRNTTTLVVDVKNQRLVELELAAERFLFSQTRSVVYVVLPSRRGVVALDLATTKELWRTVPMVAADASVVLARLSADDSTILLADYERVFFLDAETGDVRGATKSGPGMNDLEVLPGGTHALVVGDTVWRDGGPHTPVSLVPLDGSASATIDVPNCAAPVAIVNEGTRALLSPTFCTADAKARAQGWANPDPVSVIDIDLAARSLAFRKNLPGFGPVALVGDGRAVAYLDMKRLDPAMFDDKSQIPPANAKQYHLMTIDPKTLAFDLHPIGDVLPRFAPSKDGRSLLVDGSVSVVRSESSASASVTLDATGLRAEVRAGAFGDPSGSLFGVFTLADHRYTPFQGPAASLDRFVQLGDGSRVFTLRENGRGGDLFAIDLAARSSVDLGKSLRDIAILPDGKTLVLRIRLEASAEGHLRERFCLSLDAESCTTSIDYQSPIPMHDP